MGYNEEISVLRDKINEIDTQMIALFEERMQTTGKVANTKMKYGKNVFDAKREDAVITRAISHLSDQTLNKEITSFFHALMDISKKSQQKAMRVLSPQTSIFTPIPQPKVGYLGIKGSYSHIAATQVFDCSSALKNYSTFEGIFEGMKEEVIDYAMLPAENTETGSITAVVDLLAKYGYYIVGEKILPVSHSLLGVNGSDISDIKKVYTHPEVLSQCRDFLHEHPDIEAYPSLSTAQAAKTVSELGDKHVACIASKQAGDIYGLTTLQSDIQNNDNNCTRFVIIARSPYQSNICNKTSIVLMLAHKPGSLCEMLKVFYDGGINILKLESRPLKDRPFEYLFHIDFEGSMYDVDIAKTIEQVKQLAAGFTYLGCYPRERMMV